MKTVKTEFKNTNDYFRVFDWCVHNFGTYDDYRENIIDNKGTWTIEIGSNHLEFIFNNDDDATLFSVTWL